MKNFKTNFSRFFGLFFLSICFVLFCYEAPVAFAEEEQDPYLVEDDITGYCDYEQAYEVLAYVNVERQKAGLNTLTMDKELMEAAMLRCAEIVINFDHTRPDGTRCFTVSDRAYGENIAYGHTDSYDVMYRNSYGVGFMYSQGHKDNILNERWNCAGIGCIKYNGRYYWCQLFSGYQAITTTKPTNANRTFSVVASASFFAPGWQYGGGDWYYIYSDYSLKSGWQMLGGKWYYMNSNYQMQTGWICDGGKWYYTNSSGEMVTGWVYTGGKWYYMNSSGAMQTGWVYTGGKWYYMNSSGAMQTGWIYTGGKWYYMNSSGAMQTGWVSIGGKWYYMNSSGEMQTGWVYTRGKWYYMDSSGVMQTGWKYVGDKCYYFYANGAMAANTYVEGYYLNPSGVWIP